MADIEGREPGHDSTLRSGLSRKRRYQDVCKSISSSVKRIAKKTKLDSTDSKSKETTFKYGNYNRYYGYRNENKQEDKRLTVFKQEWFQGKYVLDIGSNVGHITLWIGKNYNPEKIKGVDIDCDLVKCAKRNIVHYIDENYVSEMERSFNNDDSLAKSQSKNPSEDLKGENTTAEQKDPLDEKKNTEEQLAICEKKSKSVMEISDEKLVHPEEALINVQLKSKTLAIVVETNSSYIHKKEENTDTETLPIVNEIHIPSTNKDEETENQSAVANQKQEKEDEVEDEVEVDLEKQEEIGKGFMQRLEKNSNAVQENAFPYNVSFILENYVPGGCGVLKYVKEEYHTILCLSVTKWIQLNFGDSGLKLMFQKIYKQLHPGGRLILEPQPYKSYKRRKNLTPAIRRNYDGMKLMPDEFIDYLLSEEVGFVKSEQVDTTLHEKQGFQRPMYVLTK